MKIIKQKHLYTSEDRFFLTEKEIKIQKVH